MDKKRFFDNHRYIQIEKDELERKWRVLAEQIEQEKFYRMVWESQLSKDAIIPSPSPGGILPDSSPRYDPQTFVSVWNTDPGNTGAKQIRLPLISGASGSYNFVVDWGDGITGSVTASNQPSVTHTYSNPGVYEINITGKIHGFSFNNVGDKLKLSQIKNWGSNFRLGATGAQSAHFYGCTNLDLSEVEDVLNLEGTTSLANSFRNCLSLTTVNRMNEWDTKNITTMSNLFNVDTSPGVAGRFNQNIGNWNTSKVTTMTLMFQNQPDFNQDISTKVVTINGATYTAWDTKEVTNMAGLFNIASVVNASSGGKFNQNIGNWNTSKVNNMSAMFSRQHDFNQDISTKVVTVNDVTYTAWDTKEVTTMSFMFNASPSDLIGKFNQNIGNWNTSKVTNISYMFNTQPYFNHDISTKEVTVNDVTYNAWTTSLVTKMQYMFYNSSSSSQTSQFNQNIGNWDTYRVTDMTAMFFNGASFNQNIGNWDVSSVGLSGGFNSTTTITDTFAYNNGLSSANYDSLLIGWSSGTGSSGAVRPDLSIDFRPAKYTTNALAARTTLTSEPYRWTITDGGPV